MRDIVNVDAFRFDPVSVASQYLDDTRKIKKEGLTAVLSHERLSGYPGSGGFDSKLIADRLFECFPQAKVFIVIREQRSAILSWYKQYVRDGGGLSLKRFLTSTEIKLFRMPGFRREFFEYDGLISYYKERFYPENVLALPYELFVESRDEFLYRLCSFAVVAFNEVPVADKINPSTTALQVAFRRLGNRLFSLNQLNKYALVNSAFIRKSFWKIGDIASRNAPVIFISYFEKMMQSEIDKFSQDYYRESNKRTCALIGIPLENFGYDS
jgi:hypothetical protein